MPWQLFLEQFNGIVASVFCEVNRYEACDLHGIARRFPSLHDAEVWLAVLTESGSWVASGHSRCHHPQLCVNVLTRSLFAGVPGVDLAVQYVRNTPAFPIAFLL